MIKITTGSQISRVIRCPGSQGLPHVRSVGGEPQELGNAVHTYLCSISEGVNPIRAAECIEESYTKEAADVCREIDLDLLKDVLAGTAEVSLAYSSKSGGRVLGTSLGRDYSGVKPGEIAMTIDVLIVGDDYVIVLDFKTGRTDLGPAKKSDQLLPAAVAAASAYNKPKAFGGYIYLRDGNQWRDMAEWDAFDLEAYASKMERMEEELSIVEATVAKGQTPDVTTGNHCKFCPAWNACPAQKSLAIELATGNDAAPFNQALSRGLMAEAWERIKLYQTMINKVKKAIISEAGREPIALSNGKTLGSFMKEGNEKLDGSVVHEVISGMYGDDVADSSVTFSATKSGIKAALKDHKIAKPTAVQKKVIEAVREAGGATRSKSTKVDEY
jgi:hypothetical protein